MSDDFADIRGVLSGFGCLGGMGADAHHTAQQHRAEDGSGITYTVPCDNCGIPNAITVSWDEFIYGLARQVPPGWKYEARFGAFHPNVGCRSCRGLLLITLTPDECQRNLKAGEAEGKVTGAYIANAMQTLKARGQGVRG